MNLDLLLAASLEEIKQGYIEHPDGFVCLFCGRSVDKGIIYPDDGILYEASRYIRVHIKQAHGSVFDALRQLDKKTTGLSEHQNRLLELFYQGKSDAEVQEVLGIGSASTIRNHRFALREKERQAKVFLAMMELLNEKDRSALTDQNKKKGVKTTMDRERKKELLEQYRQVGPEAGVYQIRNTKNNKVFIETTPNLKTINGAPGPLNNGMHPNHQLQSEWKEYGQDAFVFEVLEVLKKKDEPFDLRDELKKLKQKWLEQLQPYGERGYHRPETGKGDPS